MRSVRLDSDEIHIHRFWIMGRRVCMPFCPATLRGVKPIVQLQTPQGRPRRAAHTGEQGRELIIRLHTPQGHRREREELLTPAGKGGSGYSGCNAPQGHRRGREELLTPAGKGGSG